MSSNSNARKILSNKKKESVIKELIASLDDKENCTSNISVIVNVFLKYWSDKTKLEAEDGREVEEMTTIFKQFADILLKKLFEIQDKKLLTVSLDYMKCEMLLNRRLMQGESFDKLHFPNQIWFSIIERFITCENVQDNLTKILIELQNFDDIKFYTCKNIVSLLKTFSKTSAMEQKLNISILVEVLLACSSDPDRNNDHVTLYMEDIVDDNVDLTMISKSMKSAISSSWLSVLSYPKLESSMLKKILMNIESNIIPSLVDPKLLIDFLTDTYNMGGVYSLLALNGLFILMNEHNLDYPNFYSKLYQLLTPNVFYAKHKSRFFYLIDLFLSSTHLPSYLVMAFTKKLSRMALFSPIEDIDMILLFIQNMLIRHPSAQVLIHQKNASRSSISKDPYNFEEDDPLKCCASESCLWELGSLKMHYSSDTIKLVSLFEKDLPKVEHDITDYLEISYDIIGKKFDVGKSNDVPRNYLVEKEVFGKMNKDLWEFS